MRITTSKLTSVAVAAGFAVGVLGIAGPASAAPDGGDTLTTFTIEGGTLNIMAPPSTSLGAFDVRFGHASGQLGPVAVVDDRAALDASWTVSVSSSSFSTGDGLPGEVLTADRVSYTSGGALWSNGLGMFTPTVSPLSLAAPVTAFSHTGGSGINFAEWNPTLDFFFAPGQVAGDYSGVITHSLA